jgi:hypothetical protein
MTRILIALTLAAISITDRSASLPVFTTLGMSPDEVAAVDAGTAVAKTLPWGGPSEVYVFGAIHVNGLRDTYLKAARDVERFNSMPGYLAVHELGENASETDLRALELDPNDLKALQSCREGDCDLQLPTHSIRAFQDAIDFTGPDPEHQANALARTLLLRLVRAYREGGHAALGEYRDKQRPWRVGVEFETMLDRASVLPDVLPELRRYLLDYPHATLANAESYFYWEKVDFGLKPTIRANHAVIYRGRTQGREFGVVAIKQLYASHYFHTALDVSVCVDDGTQRGFYLLTLKGSQQDGLTGIKGAMLRKVAVDRTRHALESALLAIKRDVERVGR